MVRVPGSFSGPITEPGVRCPQWRSQSRDWDFTSWRCISSPLSDFLVTLKEKELKECEVGHHFVSSKWNKIYISSLFLYLCILYTLLYVKSVLQLFTWTFHFFTFWHLLQCFPCPYTSCPLSQDKFVRDLVWYRRNNGMDVNGWWLSAKDFCLLSPPIRKIPHFWRSEEINEVDSILSALSPS